MGLTDEEASVVEVIAADPALAARANRIADMMLGRIERIVKNGNDASVLSMAGKVMPAILKALGDRGADDDLRREWLELRAEMRAYASAEAEQVSEVAEDAAPEPAVKSGSRKGGSKAPELRVSTKAMRDRDEGMKAARQKRGARGAGRARGDIQAQGDGES